MMKAVKSAIRATVKKNDRLLSSALKVVGMASSRIEKRARIELRVFPSVISMDVSPLGDRLNQPLRLYSADGQDQSATALYAGGWAAYEHPLPALICAALKESDFGAWVDIGANTGIYSVMVKAIQSNRLSYAFEPFPYVLDFLEQNIRLNSSCVDLRVVRAAASDCLGTAKLFIPSQEHGLIETSASLSAEFRSKHSDVLEISTIPLDQFVPLMTQRIAVMKVDVEGAEDRVLRGALNILRESKPVVFCEILPASGTWGEISRLLGQVEYEMAAIEPTQIRLGITGPGKSQLEGEVDNFILFPKGSKIVEAVAARAHLQVIM